MVEHLDLSAITARYQGEERGGPPYHPRMMVPRMMVPGMMVPRMMVPRMMVPRMMVPRMMVPRMMVPRMMVPRMMVPRMMVPRMMVPRMMVPRMMVPRMMVPRMMVKVLLYGYCTGVASSRRIAQRLHEDIAFRVLTANNAPDFRTISDFRKDHLAALACLFHQVLELCRQAGLVKLGHVALDSTKVRANASRHKAMSYGRMKEREAQLKAEVDELLRRAGEVDEEEDRRYGRDKRGDELPEELSFREGRLRKIREAKAALEAEAQAAAEQAEAESSEHPEVPDDKAQRNFTDPDSRIMPGPGGRDFQQSYNCQAQLPGGGGP